jgi:hypothetical protein
MFFIFTLNKLSAVQVEHKRTLHFQNDTEKYSTLQISNPPQSIEKLSRFYFK